MNKNKLGPHAGSMRAGRSSDATADRGSVVCAAVLVALSLAASVSRVYAIPKGTSWITSEDWFVIPTKSLYMRMVVKINWKNAATGKSLGDYRGVFNQARDYRCVTQYPCQVMADSIWLKAPGT
jgi:hypothetical protein